MPTTEALRDYYGTYYASAAESRTVTHDEPERFARHLYTIAAPFDTSRTLTILDFGGGGGEVSISLAKLLLTCGVPDVSIALVDYNSALNPVIDQRVAVSRHQTFDEVAGRTFDLVIASAILEHIPQPRPTLLGLLRATGKGGAFYARTPSVSAVLRLLNKVRVNVDFTFPAHVHDLGQKFWENVLPRETDLSHLQLQRSRPSLVETNFRRNPLRTTIAYSLKAPWYALGSRYQLVGGWEVLIRHIPSRNAGVDAPN